MATTPTNLPVPSEKPQDLKYNAGKIDEFVTSKGWTYIDRFGDQHYTIEGNNYLAQQAMAAFGYVILTDKTFTTGATISNPNEVLLHVDDGEYYKWTGSFVTGGKVVPANSSPDSTGGVGPGAWVGVGDASLRAALAEPDVGDALVMVKQPKPNVIARTQHDFNADFINVKDYGAKGDWNATTQSGTDDTAAFQAAINGLGNATFRSGGVRILRVPAGNYKITSITIPAAFNFGVVFVGDGPHNTIIFGDHTNNSPAILSQIEFVRFIGFSLYGSTLQSSNSTTWKTFYRGKQYANNPDIDVRFTNCELGYSTNAIEAYGRGVVIDASCTAVYCSALLNIVCSPDTIFPGGTNNSLGTGMRNYYISLSRADVVSKLVVISGTGPQKEYINDINITSCDLSACDRLIDFPDATIQRVSVSGVTAIDSFQAGLLTGKRIVDADISVVAAKGYNRDFTSSSVINGIVTLTGPATNLRVSGNYRDLSAHAVLVGAESSNINLDIQVYSLAANGNAFTAVTGANCNGITANIECAGAIPSSDCRFFLESTQVNPNYKCRATGKTFLRPAVIYQPQLVVGVTAQTPTFSRGEVRYDTNYAYVSIQYGFNVAAATGNAVYITLYGTPLADNITAGVASGQVIIESCSVKAVLRGEIDITNKRIQFYKPDGNTLVESNLGAVGSGFNIKLSLKYPVNI